MAIYDRRFVPLTSDAGFKAVFACRSNKALLIEFLNRLLPDGVVIRDILEYCDREQQKDTLASKKCVLDLICRGDDGSQFIVEVQDEYFPDFFKRVVFYAAGVYHLSLDERQGYSMLRPVYVIGILNHRLAHSDESQWDTDHIISHYEFLESRTKEFATRTISVTFAELGRFTKCLCDCTSDLDYLFYWFIHAPSLDEVPDVIVSRPFLNNVASACEYAAFSKEQKLNFEKNMINELDKSYAIDQHYRRGLAEGEAKGARETASRFLMEGIPAETVSKCTGLSLEEVMALQASSENIHID